MTRLIDILLSLGLILILILPFFIICIYLSFFTKGRVLFLSKRFGKNSTNFYMYKFRTMRNDTPDVATHLLNNPQKYLLPLGNFLRKSSLDEIPQLLNILKGDMTFIGPRPALYNQADLMELRTKFGINMQKPGITGWAQVNGRDSISIPDKVELEKFYLKNKNILLDIKIIFLTIFKILKTKDVSH